MKQEKEITAEDLKKALRQMSRDAYRKNKALGLETKYVKDGYLVELDSSGKEHRIRKMEWVKNPSQSRVIKLN